MTSTLAITHDDRRARARRLLVAAVVSACVTLPGAHLAAAVDPAPSPEVSVREERGTYTVTARFEVPQSPAVVLAVLSNYEQIPRFVPDVKTSIVLDRAPGRFTVEQRAVSKFMMFSKQVHLVLEVTETEHAIEFTDRCGQSFKSYQGSWQLERKGAGTVVIYQLSAEPNFDVPEFILKRLLKRDSGQLIQRLRSEFASHTGS